MGNNVKGISAFIKESRTKKKAEEVAEGISILDQITNSAENEEETISEFVKDFIRPNGPCIYAFITDKVKDAVKVGYTDQHPEKRIAQWKEEYGKEEGEVICIGYWSSEEFNAAGERVFFWDHAVHDKLRNKNYKQLDKNGFMNSLTDAGKKIVDIHFSREFFSKYKVLWNGEIDPADREELSAELLKDLMNEMKANIRKGTSDFKLYSFTTEGKTSTSRANEIWDSPDTYEDTDLQKDTIEKGVEAIKKGKKNILMAAVMRFGKTHATYEIIKKAGLKNIVICSAKADVRASWRNDINHKDFYKDFVFVEVLDEYTWDVTYCANDKLTTEHKRVYEDTDIYIEHKGKTILFFFTLHDLGGSINEIKNKHKKVFDKEFDLLVVDETHYGSHANTFGKVTKFDHNIEDDDNSDIEEEQEIAKESEEALKKLNINYKCALQVSGTPYYILASNEMIQEDAEIISKVSYSDMLRARDKWNAEHKHDDPSTSPYFGIPTLHKIGLRLNKKCRDALKNGKYTDSMTELFKTKGDKFVYESAIKDLIKSLFGDTKDTLAFLKNKDVEGNKVCKHTIVVLPRVASCAAMKRLLQETIDTDQHHVFNIVGKEGKIQEVKDINDLNNQLEILDEKGKNSIILTVNRFLTGVSMPLVDSMIYLKNASSPQEYDQNIFRLCTRHVKKVKNPDSEFTSKKVNMKENVYLIDFNIANMMRMITNSARMKAAAEGDPRPERIKELMIEDLGATPIFCEGKLGSEVMGKMKKIDSADLMEIYSGYNKDKSINDIVNDEIDLFVGLFTDEAFQKAMSGINVEGDKSKNSIEGQAEGDEDIEGLESDGKKSLKDFSKDNIDSHLGQKDKEAIKITKEKFKAITKNLLYCNICLDDPYSDLDAMVERAKKDKEFQTMLSEFNIPLDEFYKVYQMMGTNYKQSYNAILTNMVLMANDTSKEGYDRFMKALKGLGRIDKNEVITPPEIVKKMIEKLDESEYKKAESILIVNDKQGEFFYGLHKKFGGKYDEKIKIVPSSQVGRHLTIKALKTLGVDDYINMIIDLKDYDNDKKINVKDFLKMTNEEVLKKNGGKKFDVVLQNPPYSISGDAIHLQFVEKCLKIAHKQIAIYPYTFITVDNKQNKKYKEIFDNYIESVQQESSTQFVGTHMPDVAIYKFSDDKKSNNIEIKPSTGDSYTVSSLLDISKFSNYENNIIKLFENREHLKICSGTWYPSKKDYSKEQCLDILKENTKKYPKDKIYLTCNSINGGCNGRYFTPKNGNIFSKFEDLIESFYNSGISNGYHVAIFDSIKEAENCKAAMQNNVLRFILYRLQDNQRMTVNKCYRIPGDIDWSNDRVKTDEGLLEVCGCPKDKCKEYADYCKKIIDEVDAKK